MENYISSEELVFNMDKDAGVYSGGFNVNSIMMKAGMSPIMTINSGQLGGGSNVSDLFKDLVIPSWTLSYHSKMNGGGEYKDDESDSDSDSDSDIDDDLHDKLVNLVRENESKLQQQNKKKTTRRQKAGAKKSHTKKKK